MSNIVGAIDEMCGLSEEAVDASGDDDGLKFALLAGGAGVDVIAGVLGDRKGLARQG